MVKLSKEAKQRLQQLFKGGQFAIRWGFIPLVIYLGFKRGADPGMPEPTILRFNFSLLFTNILAYFGDEGLFGHLDLEAVMDRRNMEGVHAGWDKKWDIVQTFTIWVAQGSYLTDASLAEWNLF
ncbi:mitochondrial import receptor subunit TOM7 homolog isoform X1 [Choloepus didactylus]|uniref:mitochondrial import receptor subunit TOM7 homolog isoform X1 n=1 Tax=Choloepus didactylus TaxID=27675 RepID=UPI0018A0DC7E|nr:mitochondrial import receptor subunit TOM7 homolog isoform X1 [Choloepus didactylus]